LPRPALAVICRPMESRRSRGGCERSSTRWKRGSRRYSAPSSVA
jgi:hypothetical protein